MKNVLRLLILSLLTAFVLSSCDEFPKFEGTYTGTLTISSQIYDYPVESSATVVIERDFKDITADYTSGLGTFTLSGKIDNEGNFSISVTGYTTENEAYLITDAGTINYNDGSYSSVITIVVEGESAVTGTLVLTKS